MATMMAMAMETVDTAMVMDMAMVAEDTLMLMAMDPEQDMPMDPHTIKLIR